jgi:mannitol/fructose-specific phosphotransferase system IIA component (Ntr-type)
VRKSRKEGDAGEHTRERGAAGGSQRSGRDVRVERRAVGRMLVTDVIDAGAILLRQPSDSFERAVEALVAVLVEGGRIAPTLRAAALKAVCDREAMASTAIVEIGVSVPHARVSGVRGVVGAIAASPTAVYYAMAGVPISIVALILSGPDRAAEHLNVLASLSMLLQSESVRRALCEARDPAAALAAIGTAPAALR